MSGINGVGNNQPLQRVINNPVLRQVNTPGGATPSRGDKVELSGVGQMLKTLKTNGDVRTDKIADIKAQIDAGTYENDQKLDAAIDRLLDDLNG